MIKFITQEQDENEKLIFDMVEDNQFFVDYDGYLCQKVHEKSFSVIADSHNRPFASHISCQINMPINRILPYVITIEF